MDTKYTIAVVSETHRDFNAWRIDCGYRSGKKVGNHFYYNEIRYIPILKPDDTRSLRLDGVITTTCAIAHNKHYDEIMHYIDVCFVR